MSFPIINNPPIVKLSLQKSLLLKQSTDAIVKLRDDGNYLREKVKVTCKSNYQKNLKYNLFEFNVTAANMRRIQVKEIISF